MKPVSTWIGHCIMTTWMLVWLVPQWGWAEGLTSLDQCACIQNDKERLACYDRLAGRGVDGAPKGVVGPSAEATRLPEPKGKAADGELSYLTRRWDLDESRPRGHFVFIPHRQMYIMPLTYNFSPNRTPGHTGEVDAVKEAEAAFQLSMKVKLWQDVLGQDMDLWFGYTQRSFWQVYSVDDSSPFRDTNYEPELLLNYRTDVDLLGGHLRTIALGVNHQSNGRADPLSRSWNRLVGYLGWERGPFVVELRTWYRLPESEKEDDNPDIHRFMGPGELWVHYGIGGHRLGAMLRNSFRSKDNRGALQLEWAFPLGLSSVKGYVQYFNGYGESLLDYDHSVNRIGVGVILEQWSPRPLKRMFKGEAVQEACGF